MSGIPDSLTVVGTVDDAFRVERISGAAWGLFATPVTELVGLSLLDLCAADQVSACLTALTSAVASRSVINLQLRLRGADAPPIVVEAGFFPLQPVPGLAFVFFQLSGKHLHTRDGSGLQGLTAREGEIVTRLLDGDRVPAIAAKLFLSQSTVRNHLASVFAKLGVASQQQLVDSFR